MNEALLHLSSLDGVSGLCLHRGGIIRWQRLPVFITTDGAAALCSAVSRAFAAYASAERFLKEMWLGFGSHHILVMARPPEEPATAPDTFMTFLLHNRSAAPLAAGGAVEFWKSAVL